MKNYRVTITMSDGAEISRRTTDPSPEEAILSVLRKVLLFQGPDPTTFYPPSAAVKFHVEELE